MLEPKLRVWENLENETVNNTAGLIELCKGLITSDMVGCEIGSFRGASTEVFATYAKRIFAIDPWELGSDAGYTEINRKMLVEAEKQFDELCLQYHNIVKMKTFSKDGALGFEDHSLDFVYIDGNHSTESVSEDIDLWLPKIKPGGLLTGHDFSLVEKVLQSKGLQVESVYSDQSWVYRVPK